MIMYGGILGRVNFQQLFFLTFWAMLFWGFNTAFVTQKLQTVDVGGGFVVHSFGGYFGIAATYFFQP
jgi:ammonia channel protein AmtB